LDRNTMRHPCAGRWRMIMCTFRKSRGVILPRVSSSGWLILKQSSAQAKEKVIRCGPNGTTLTRKRRWWSFWKSIRSVRWKNWTIRFRSWPISEILWKPPSGKSKTAWRRSTVSGKRSGITAGRKRFTPSIGNPAGPWNSIRSIGRRSKITETPRRSTHLSMERYRRWKNWQQSTTGWRSGKKTIRQHWTSWNQSSRTWSISGITTKFWKETVHQIVTNMSYQKITTTMNTVPTTMTNPA
jgi:hypothetical protein